MQPLCVTIRPAGFLPVHAPKTSPMLRHSCLFRCLRSSEPRNNPVFEFAATPERFVALVMDFSWVRNLHSKTSDVYRSDGVLLDK